MYKHEEDVGRAFPTLPTVAESQSARSSQRPLQPDERRPFWTAGTAEMSLHRRGRRKHRERRLSFNGNESNDLGCSICQRQRARVVAPSAVIRSAECESNGSEL